MILDGRAIAAKIREEIQEKVFRLELRKPCLAFLLVGDHPASKIYVGLKKKYCSEVGILSIDQKLPQTASEDEVLSIIHKWNLDPSIDGILVQLPLPSQLKTESILSAVSPSKDVDGFHPINLGKLLSGRQDGFIPCTPLGIHVLLEKSQIDVLGKHVVILGRSNIVGKPLAALLMQKYKGSNATVTVAHSLSQNLSALTKTADVLIAAIGSPRFVKKEMVKPQSVIIDVGINQTPEGKIVGDVAYEEVAPLASHITPVPGGVGPMTIAMLLSNTLTSYGRNQNTLL